MGNDPKWPEASFDDSQWDRIVFGYFWEQNGFRGYDG